MERPDTDRLVREAAQTADRTLSDSVLDAERLLADRREFILDAEHWERLVMLLDRSPEDNPGLEKLFSKPGVFRR